MDTPDHLAPCSAYKSGVMVWVLPRNSSMWGPALPEVAEHTCCTQEELMPLFALLASVAFAFTIKISLIRPRSFYPWDPVPSPAWWGVRERLGLAPGWGQTTARDWGWCFTAQKTTAQLWISGVQNQYHPGSEGSFWEHTILDNFFFLCFINSTKFNFFCGGLQHRPHLLCCRKDCEQASSSNMWKNVSVVNESECLWGLGSFLASLGLPSELMDKRF